MSVFEARASVSLAFPARTPLVFDGPRRHDVPVMCYGTFQGCLSIDNVCTQVARQLLAAIPTAALCNYGGPAFFAAELEPFAAFDPQAPVAIIYGGGAHFVPEFFFEHEITIGGFVCETDVDRAARRGARVLPASRQAT
jgi:hypothetical protein